MKKKIYSNNPDDILKNPNFKQFKDTRVYVSRMGDIVRISKKNVVYNVATTNFKYSQTFKAGGKERYVARAIYDTFVGVKNPKNCIMHINKIVTDNRLENLKEVPRKELCKKNAGQKCKPIYNEDTRETYRDVYHASKVLRYSVSALRKMLQGKYNKELAYNLRYVEE